MTLTVRSLTDPHSYVASAVSPYGTSTFLLLFRADISGTLSLCEFAQMLRKHHDLPEIDLAFRDTRMEPSDESLLSLLREHE